MTRFSLLLMVGPVGTALQAGVAVRASMGGQSFFNDDPAFQYSISPEASWSRFTAKALAVTAVPI